MGRKRLKIDQKPAQISESALLTENNYLKNVNKDLTNQLSKSERINEDLAKELALSKSSNEDLAKELSYSKSINSQMVQQCNSIQEELFESVVQIKKLKNYGDDLQKFLKTVLNDFIKAAVQILTVVDEKSRELEIENATEKRDSTFNLAPENNVGSESISDDVEITDEQEKSDNEDQDIILHTINEEEEMTNAEFSLSYDEEGDNNCIDDNDKDVEKINSKTVEPFRCKINLNETNLVSYESVKSDNSFTRNSILTDENVYNPMVVLNKLNLKDISERHQILPMGFQPSITLSDFETSSPGSPINKVKRRTCKEILPMSSTSDSMTKLRKSLSKSPESSIRKTSETEKFSVESSTYSPIKTRRKLVMKSLKEPNIKKKLRRT